MKRYFEVAGNLFSISVDGSDAAWRVLEPRFDVFATSDDFHRSVLDVEISAGALPQIDAELIYQPAPPRVGSIAARALRSADGSLIMEFIHIDESEPWLWMRMPPQMNRAEIVHNTGGRPSGPYFLTHALMIAYMLATVGNGTLLIHASAVLNGGRAFLFQGKSGTGKSTHAEMWLNNIEGTERLNDDNPLLRIGADGVARAYGSPWSGKLNCYRNVSAPLGALVRIVRAESNELRRLSPLRAYASLTASVYRLPFMGDELLQARHQALERLVETVGCYEMHCRPDADAAFTCVRGLISFRKS